MTTKTNLKIVTIFTIALLVIPNSALGTDSTEIEIDAEIILPDYIVPDIYCEPVVTDDPIAEVEVEQINTTEIYINSYWNETTPETVSEFLSLVPRCTWYSEGSANMCGSRARYIVIESYKHGLNLSEVTISYQVGVSGGHRLNTFRYESVDYYTGNGCDGDERIFTKSGVMGELDVLHVEHFRTTDYKEFSAKWFEKHGY